VLEKVASATVRERAGKLVRKGKVKID